MPVEDAPDDEDVRQTYNFAPGYHGLVYRADVPDYGAGNRHHNASQSNEGQSDQESMTENVPIGLEDPKETKYKLQSMKWGASVMHATLGFSYGEADDEKQDWYRSGRSATQTMVVS